MMAEDGSFKYARSLTLRPVCPHEDSGLLIRFGRDLYRQSLGREDAFYRDYGRFGASFPLWIGACVAQDPAFAQLLIEDGEAIALAVMGIDEQDPVVGRVHHFYVVETHRGQGFGGILDDYARETLARSGCRLARLNVTRRNDRAIRFYKAQGWTDAHRRGGLIWMETKL